MMIRSTWSVSTLLLAAMACFGACKGLYDANIFAAVFDVIEPRARASAVGIMNAVGWGGGALGPVAVGWATQYGRHAKEVDNMSEAIAFGGIIYLAAAALLLLAVPALPVALLWPASRVAASARSTRPISR